MKHDMVWEGDTPQGHYQIIDTLYDGRPARGLNSGYRRAAQSGVALDDERDLLFDYNQRLFELITHLEPHRLLLVGGAVGTLALALLKALPTVRIDMVEPDAKLIELARKYFALPETDRLHIFFTDGASFLEQHDTVYDVLVIDAFAHTTIPANLRSEAAFSHYNDHLALNGVCVMNIISSYRGSGSRILSDIYAAAVNQFACIEVFLASSGYSLWLPQNFLLTALKTHGPSLRDYVRYDSVEPPTQHRTYS